MVRSGKREWTESEPKLDREWRRGRVVLVQGGKGGGAKGWRRRCGRTGLAVGGRRGWKTNILMNKTYQTWEERRGYWRI